MTDPTAPTPPDHSDVSPQPPATSGAGPAEVLPAEAPPKQRKTLFLAVGTALAVLLVGVGVVAILTGSESTADAAGQEKQSRLAAAREQCSASEFAKLGDEDQTLTLQGDGKESDGLPYNVLECYWRALDVPDSVVAEIGATRALDGRQTGDWDHIHASWSYHPDSGLQMVLTLSD
jgi:hypothetical protein